MWCEALSRNWQFLLQILLDIWIFIYKHKIIYTVDIYDFMLSYDLEQRPLFSVESVIAIRY